MQYIGSNIRFIFTKIKELLNSHNTDNSAHSELFKSWKRLRNPNNADIADALAATYKNGIGDVLVEVKDDTTFALEDIKLFFRPASFKLISANESDYEGIYITMDGTQGRYVAKTFADSEVMMPEGPTIISTPSELALYPAASDAVLYTPQTLTEAQQKQARTNIGALDVNIKTTPVDIGVGLGSTVYYVQSGWLRPCPDNADKELKLQYRRVFEFIGSQRLNPSSQNILLEAKSAYALYQKGLASESIVVTNNPLRAAQVYVTWNITTRSNKHYFYYAQVSTAYYYDCTYCVEDDALTSERYQSPVYRTAYGVGEQDSVSQFRMGTNPTEDMHIATKQYVDIAKTEAQQLGLTTATPGKTIKVKTVQDGKPTEWEAVDIYEKPDTGIPKSDLADDVQTSLAKADTAISYDSQTLTEEQKSQARTNIGAGQPDWNQNDSTQPDYVKNRPFYTGNPVETVLVEESTVTFAAVDGMYMGQLESTFSATIGETYKVSWDGTAYECTCVSFNGEHAIGNLSIVSAGSDTGEPFIIGIRNGVAIQIATADTSASHTISISGYAESVVKIDQKYLPVASETEPGIISITPLSNAILQQVKNEYFRVSDTQVWNYGDAATIKECADKNNSHGIFSPGKLGGAVLSCYNNTVNKYITSVLSGGANIECWKFSRGSTTMERLWGIFEDGVVISSSTTDSTKKFRITVDDSGEPTITDESDSTNTWKPTNLPTVTSSDSGKFLRVSDTGEWEAVDMPSGEKWEKIKEITIAEGAEESNALTINADENGNTFRLKKARLCAKFPAYTGTSTIPNFSFAMINGKATGRVTPLLYTSVWPTISTKNITGAIYYVDVSGAQQIEYAQINGNASWYDDTSRDYRTYGSPSDQLRTICGDTLWAKPITSIGGASMLIYPGCHFVLYGVRE